MLQAIWNVLLELSPWLLLGMCIAGALHVLLPKNFIHRQLSGRVGVFKAVALGVPLPLCSCGVIPAGLGLKRDGAGNGATVGFLISTPQTGVDSILISASFLGWPFAVFKLASAAVTGIVGGLIAETGRGTSSPDPPPSLDASRKSTRPLSDALEHALMILRSIWRWLVFGIVVSAAIEVLVPDGFFASLGGAGSLIPVLAALLISLPLYVCATASVPIAAALVSSGMPAGAALVFLMAGPATNVATIGAIYRSLGRRTLAVYLATIIVGSVVFGVTFDFLLDTTAVSVAGAAHQRHAWWAVVSAGLVVALMGWFAADDLRQAVGRAYARRRLDEGRIELSVRGMTCGGCGSRLEHALREQEGVTSVEVTLDPGRAIVRGVIDEEHVRRVIERAGFAVAGTTDYA